MANLTDREIRAATVAALVGNTDAGDRVFSSRLVPSDSVDGDGNPLDGHFPFLLVYVLKEEKKAISESGSQFQATTTVGVEVHARVADGLPLDDDALDDALDPIREQVEDALLATDWSNMFDVSMVRTQIRMAGNASVREVLALLSFDATHYKTYFRTPDPVTLDTIGGAVHRPPAADLPVSVDLT